MPLFYGIAGNVFVIGEECLEWLHLLYSEHCEESSFYWGRQAAVVAVGSYCLPALST